ncbi:sugar ABC transporter ATP-binding protein [Agrobacterium sp. AGB01]|jgi:ribose transport system ATP-binding protein|uniref:sugar ABC transporter ATP-binding protein n=1 Tax=Agrobacterium sp. AGB01 TaxID=2769302 RepID=UPI00177D1715|nr:sugar ABC transporter ATP-binding protein [Agrobacterium sp. AGB01]MBD9388837.1 sugar ABC transporter ATP-binding protein [Agrobacterium sp. AGB01]
MANALEAAGITKNFGAVRALTAGKLTVGRGEIHALLGANGCGKSTLCKIVAGAVAPTSGAIKFNGSEVHFKSPRDAENAGIALFYQELSLIPQLSVADNIFLGREPKRGVFVDRKALIAEARKLIALFEGVAGEGLEPDAIVGNLPPDQRQLVEILKVFAQNASLMIMDEATAALDGRQSQRFFEILRAKKVDGVSTIMISHRLDEVFAVCDRITVMRNGATISELDTSTTTREAVVHDMVGDVRAAPARQQGRLAAPASLKVEDATSTGVRGVTLEAYPGEILGLAGLQGQGQSALLKGLFGANPFTSGDVQFAGQKVTIAKPAQAVHNGFAYVSGDRGRDASLQGRSIFENLVAALMVREKKKLIRPASLKPRVQKVADDMKTKFAGMDMPIGTLSGGNQQKIFISRWLATAPKLLLLDDPTKGIDLGAKADLFALMRQQADAGATILFYSSEDAEILEYADRILVFNGGRISAELTGADMNPINMTRAAYGDAA